jgi:hypothetical protein
MPKPVALTPALVEAPQITPQAATLPRSAARPAKAPKPPKAPQIPLQVRLPRDEVRAIKIAAAEREQTLSDFMLACFHAYMKPGGHA